MNKEINFLGQLGQGRHARVRLGLIGQQYRAIKMFEARFHNEFERERAIFEADLVQHPNILGRRRRLPIVVLISRSKAFFGADFFAKATETCHMLIFEWHPYGTLHDLLKENKNELTIERVLQYSTSLADGLAHLHAMKYGTHGRKEGYAGGCETVRLDTCKPQMAHCDIKSSNVLVKLNGDCCLADFSLAVRCDP